MKIKRNTWYRIEIKSKARQALIFNGKGNGLGKTQGLGFNRIYTENFAFNSMVKADYTTVTELSKQEVDILSYEMLGD